jgi:hypothetical protein
MGLEEVKRRGCRMVFIFLAMFVPLLLIGCVFAVMANSSSRRGKSGSPGTASTARQGRAHDDDF